MMTVAELVNDLIELGADHDIAEMPIVFKVTGRDAFPLIGFVIDRDKLQLY